MRLFRRLIENEKEKFVYGIINYRYYYRRKLIGLNRRDGVINVCRLPDIMNLAILETEILPFSPPREYNVV